MLLGPDPPGAESGENAKGEDDGDDDGKSEAGLVVGGGALGGGRHSDVCKAVLARSEGSASLGGLTLRLYLP